MVIDRDTQVNDGDIEATNEVCDRKSFCSYAVDEKLPFAEEIMLRKSCKIRKHYGVVLTTVKGELS